MVIFYRILKVAYAFETRQQLYNNQSNVIEIASDITGHIVEILFSRTRQIAKSELYQALWILPAAGNINNDHCRQYQ